MNNNVEYQILFLATAMIGFTDMIKHLLLLMVWEIRFMTHNVLLVIILYRCSMFNNFRFTYIYQIYISSFKLRAMYIMNRPFDTSVICFVQNQDLLVFAFEQQNIEQLVNWLPISRLLEHVLRILHNIIIKTLCMQTHFQGHIKRKCNSLS